jgi:probable phosphoglycerate mutase
MTVLAVIRHGATDWNAEGRLQGRQDIPLSERTRQELATLRPPPELDGFAWVTSPLDRARETARFLTGTGGDTEIPTELALIEMAWGDWEGATLAALRARHGDDLTDLEHRGLDFLPPRGESPRMVQARLRPWLAALGARGHPTVAVTHKGVIRALLGLATGWNFLGKPPAKLDWAAAHSFTIDRDGRPHVDRLNLPLAPR